MGEPLPTSMSPPAVMPGSLSPPRGLASLPQPAEGPLSGETRDLPPPPQLDAPQPDSPDRPFTRMLLGLLQTGLGSALLALSFAVLRLGSIWQVENVCSACAGGLAIICGILGLKARKRPKIILDKLCILLSIICALLSLAGFILESQSIQFVSRVPRCNLVVTDEKKTCFCCEEIPHTNCREAETLLLLNHVKTCSSAHLNLKKILLGLCILNALTITVCLTAAVLLYVQITGTRGSCIDEAQIEDEDHILDPVDFVPPVPPPSYFATFNSSTPQTKPRTLVSGGLSLPHIYAVQINDVEVFFPLDPPPPYEAVSSNSSEQMPRLPKSSEFKKEKYAEQWCPELLYLESCDELTTFTTDEDLLKSI